MNERGSKYYAKEGIPGDYTLLRTTLEVESQVRKLTGFS